VAVDVSGLVRRVTTPAGSAYEGREMAAAPGLTLTVYTAEPGSAHEEELRHPTEPTHAPTLPKASSNSNRL